MKQISSHINTLFSDYILNTTGITNLEYAAIAAIMMGGTTVGYMSFQEDFDDRADSITVTLSNQTPGAERRVVKVPDFTVTNTVRAERGNSNVQGTDESDKIVTTAQNVVSAGGGNDYIDANMGYWDGGDTIDGGDGIDTVDYSTHGIDGGGAGGYFDLRNGEVKDIGTLNTETGSYRNYYGHMGRLRNIENIIGMPEADIIKGSDVDNYLDGGEGPGFDYIEGRGGNDKILGRDGNDGLYGGSGDDEIDGGNGNDIVKGDSGNDTLYGRAGDDKMTGGTGDDVIVGGEGNDIIYYSQGDGDDEVYGGVGRTWVDTLDLVDVDPYGPNSTWTITLTVGSIASQTDSTLALGVDASGTITFSDGSKIIFQGIERITFPAPLS